MAHHPIGSMPFPAPTHQTAGAPKSLFLFALALLALATTTSAFALTSTTTALAVTSSGTAVTTVPAKTVVTLTATVKAGSTPVKVGQVNFCDATAAYCTDIHVLGTAQLTSTGTAVMKFRPGVGDHSYKALFLGTISYASSASSASALAVTETAKIATTTAITQSGTLGDFNLTATVAGVGSLASPTGTVSFLDTSNSNNLLGTAELGAGALSLSSENLPTALTDGLPSIMAAGDFNGDGFQDLAELNFNYVGSCAGGWPFIATVVILLGNGDGTFTQASEPVVPCDLFTLAVADFNGDGVPDVAALGQDGSTVTVLLGKGDGTFKSGTSVPTGVTDPGADPLAVGDFNGDGVPDLAILNYVTTSGGTAGSVSVLLANGDGTFKPAVSTPTTAIFGWHAVGDFNGDGKADLAFGDQYANSLTILLGNEDGTFTQTPTSPSTGGNPASIAVADFNGDGKIDIAVTNESGGSPAVLTVLLGNGDGTFTAALSPSTTVTPYAMAVGDFNADGVPDLAVFTLEPYAVTILLGDGSGAFEPATSANAGFGLTSLAAADFNGDGITDIALGDYAVYTPSPVQSALGVLLTQWTETATATANGISLLAYTGTHQVKASYPGDDDYSPSTSGTIGLSTQQVVLSPTSLSFGSELVGDSTSAQGVTLTNNGTSTLTIGSIKLTAADATSFVTSNTCGGSVAVGATCKIGVRLVPTTTGPLTAAVSLTDSASNSPQSISLSGTGISAPAATLSLSTASLSFGSEELGDSTAAQAVTVTNTSSTATLYFKSITLTGTDDTSFVNSNTCGASLAAGAKCSIGVRFAPTAVGAATAAVTLTDSATNSPQGITLSGTGATAPAASLELAAYYNGFPVNNGYPVTSVSFADEPVGSSSAATAIYVTNTSSVTAYFSSIKLTGATVSSFVSSNTCGASLLAGDQCHIGVRFVPTKTGPLTAAITLTDNATGSPQSITLTGTGQ